MIPLQIGEVRVELHDGFTRTVFPDGVELHALHAAQPGQAATARAMGYATPEAMNRDHDLAHSLLAHFLGLPFSPALYGAAIGAPATDLIRYEEDAVLALQGWAVRQGVDLVLIARKVTAQSTT